MKGIHGIVAIAAFAICGGAGSAWAVAEAEPTETAEAVETMEAAEGVAADVREAAGSAEPTPAAVPQASVEVGPSEGSVARAAFTREIVEREPTEELDALEPGVEEVLYFTELRGLGGRTVTHRWQLDGALQAEVPFEVGGPRWRVYSSKQLDPEASGRWSVEVVDEDGRVLRDDAIGYRVAGSESSASESAAPAAPSDAPPETGTPEAEEAATP